MHKYTTKTMNQEKRKATTVPSKHKSFIEPLHNLHIQSVSFTSIQQVIQVTQLTLPMNEQYDQLNDYNPF